MTDTVDRATRSRIMARIRSKNTGPELALRRALRAAGLRGYRVHWRAAPGTPDVAFVGARVAVFVDSWWHGLGGLPKSNRAFWREKFRRNRERDDRVTAELRRLGWWVCRVEEAAMPCLLPYVVETIKLRVGYVATVRDAAVPAG